MADYEEEKQTYMALNDLTEDQLTEQDIENIKFNVEYRTMPPAKRK